MLASKCFRALCRTDRQFSMPKRFVLMRKYAFLREQLDLKLMEDKIKQQEESSVPSSTKNQLRDKLREAPKEKDSLVLKSITSFKSLKEEVYKSFMNFEQDQGVKWKRFSGLNKLLKGHRPGELTIFTGECFEFNPIETDWMSHTIEF